MFVFDSFSQDGFKIIEKSEQQIRKGNYDKAMKLLEQADSANYGFCGNAWWDAEYKISKLKTVIYDKKQDFYSCVKSLNKPIRLYQSHDSLKMIYLIKLAGKENVKKELDQFIDSFKYEFSLEMNSLEVLFSFFDEPYYFSILELRNEVLSLKSQDFSDEEAFIIALRKQPFYRMLTH